MTTTTKPPTAAKVMREMEERQKREGFSNGYLSNEVRAEKPVRMLDLAVLAFLKGRGYDLEDAYQALNSRNGRHLGDWLFGAPEDDWQERIRKSLWPTPAAMWEDFRRSAREAREAVPVKGAGPHEPLDYAEWAAPARPNPNTHRVLKAGRILGEWAVMAHSANDREFKDGTCWLRGFSCLGEAKLMVERLQSAMDEAVR